MIELTVAKQEDLEAVLALLIEYKAESIYKHLTYNDENARNYIGSWIANDFCFLGWLDGKLVAIAVMSITKTFYDEVEADVETYYIHPEARGSGISRLLVENICKNAEANNAAVIYSSCLSGLGEKNDHLYKNLWSKFGFKELGTVLIKVEGENNV